MKHKFYYVKTGIWYRPIIPITLRFDKVQVNYLALLDSGSDFNMFHGDIAKILKIDFSKQKHAMEFSGIKEGSTGKGYFMSFDIGIKNKFFTTTAVFSNDISNNGYGILGEQGFFNNYRILFNYQTKEVIIENL